jgi:hypothetical protein
MALATYTEGPPVRPNIVHDNGFLDVHARREPTSGDYARRAAAVSILELAEAGQGVPFVPHNDISDALAAFRHFLYGNGRDRTFSYERYVANDRSGASTLTNAIKDAQAGAIQIFRASYMSRGSGDFRMTSSALAASARSAYFPYPATENWQKAIGAHNFWLSADVQVTGPGPTFAFAMDFTLHAEDRYNFNPGAADIATGAPDDLNGQLEVSGLAQQYTNYATLTRHVTWTGLTVGVYQATNSSGRRVRQPDDNRRIRNRT